MSLDDPQSEFDRAEEQINNGNYSEGERICNQTLAMLTNASDVSDWARGERVLSQTFWRRGNAESALVHAERALGFAERETVKNEYMKALLNLAQVYQFQADYSRALEYYGKALAMNEEVGKRGDAAVVRGNIGLLYRNLGDYDKSLEYMLGALATHEELGRKRSAAIITGNIGNLYYSIGDYTVALEYYTKGLSALEQLGMKAAEANMYGNIGSVYGQFADYDKSFEYLTKALEAHEKLEMYADTALVIGSLGSLYATEKFSGYNQETAEEYLRKAAGMNDESGSKSQNVTVYKALAELYASQKRWETVEYYTQYIALKDEIQNETISKQGQQFEHRRKIEESERDRQVKLARFQEQEKILHNILPAKIAERIVLGEKTIVESYESVTVLFADIVGFTTISQQISPEVLVAGLNSIFNTFDILADKHGCEKIKTIGDCYMVVAGLPERCDDHAERLGNLALDMLDAIENFPALVEDSTISMRIGLHSGSVVAGIIGKNKYSYDLWGDAVNTASRMESHGEPGKIHVSEEFKQTLQKGPGLSQESPKSPNSLHFQERGELDIKGKGMMKTYFLEKATL